MWLRSTHSAYCIRHASDAQDREREREWESTRKRQSTCLLRYKLFDDRMKIRWNKIQLMRGGARVEFNQQNGISSLLTRHFVASGNHSHATHAVSYQHSIQFTHTHSYIHTSKHNRLTRKWSDNKVNGCCTKAKVTDARMVWMWTKAWYYYRLQEIDWPLTAYTKHAHTHTLVTDRGQLRNNDDTLLYC